jgi:hypothetical protein
MLAKQWPHSFAHGGEPEARAGGTLSTAAGSAEFGGNCATLKQSSAIPKARASASDPEIDPIQPGQLHGTQSNAASTRGRLSLEKGSSSRIKSDIMAPQRIALFIRAAGDKQFGTLRSVDESKKYNQMHSDV